MVFPLIMRYGGEGDEQYSLDSDVFESANKLVESIDSIQDQYWSADGYIARSNN